MLKLTITTAGDRIVNSTDDRAICRNCLKDIEDNEWIYFCRATNKVYCSEKKCKLSFCNTLEREHEDVFSVFKKVRGKKDETRKETGREFDEVKSVFEL